MSLRSAQVRAGRGVENESVESAVFSGVHSVERRFIYAGLIVYLGLMIIGEISTTYYRNIEVGLLIHMVILVGLIVASAVSYRDRDLCFFAMCLIVTPVIRILSSSMQVSMLDPLYWFLLINFPMLLITFMLVGYQGLSREDLGLVIISPEEIDRMKAFGVQAMVVATGPFLGITEYYILRPEPIVDHITPVGLLTAFLTFTVFTGLIEEVVFRGFIQTRAEKVMGATLAILFTGFLFMIMHIGWKSVYDLLFVFSVGVFYSVVFHRTRTLSGITISHGLTNTVLFTVAPFFF